MKNYFKVPKWVLKCWDNWNSGLGFCCPIICNCYKSERRNNDDFILWPFYCIFPILKDGHSLLLWKITSESQNGSWNVRKLGIRGFECFWFFTCNCYKSERRNNDDFILWPFYCIFPILKNGHSLILWKITSKFQNRTWNVVIIGIRVLECFGFFIVTLINRNVRTRKILFFDHFIAFFLF